MMTRFRHDLLVLAGLTVSCGGVTQKTYPGPPEYVGGTGGGGSGGTSIGSSGAGMMSVNNGATGGIVRGDPPSDPDGVWPSIGCGRALPAEQVPTIPGSRTGYTEFFVNQTGATLGAAEPSKAGQRQFFVRVPADYDSGEPYRVVYVAQGCGDYRSANTSTYPLFDEAQGGSEQAIYVALSPPDGDASFACYDGSSGAQSQEWEAFDLVHAFVESHYCTDNNRIFVAGYSSGGWLANMWGCYFGGPSPDRPFAPQWRVRGRAVVSGNMPPNQPMPCSGPSAGLWFHDINDLSTPLSSAIGALELALDSNGCIGNYDDGPKDPWVPAEPIPGLASFSCQRYIDCPRDIAARYPLVFCTSSGVGRGDSSAAFIPAFTQLVNELQRSP